MTLVKRGNTVEELSICTVCFDHYKVLSLNFGQLASRNKKVRFNWFIVDNSSKGHDEENIYYVRNFKLLDGVDKPSVPYAIASYHHGLGLNKCITHAQSRFVLVIDPDFFILRDEALFEMITHMKRKGLGLLGVPWHPRHFIKYRDFPCLHCIMIDTNLVKRNSIDFRPIYDNGQFSEIKDLPTYKSIPSRIRLFNYLSVLDRMLKRLDINLLNFQERATIGRSMDTGARIYQQYYFNEPRIHECLKPIIHKSQLMSSKGFRARVDKFVDQIMPDFFRIDPGGYAKCKTKFPGVEPESAPEEFCWNGQYFGFHLRLFPKGSNAQRKIFDQLEGWIT